MPPLSQVFAVRGYLALFIAASLSTWGDYIARLTIAAVVYDRTQSPLATATTLAVSLVPSIFGRSVLGPVADRIPYKYVLIASHVSRAAMVLVLIWAVSVQAPVPALLVALFVLEMLGGPAVRRPAGPHDRPLRRPPRVPAGDGPLGARGAGQPGPRLALGGIIVLALGAARGLVLDLVDLRRLRRGRRPGRLRPAPFLANRGPALSGFFADLGTAAGS